jgi:hypothetical protein
MVVGGNMERWISRKWERRIATASAIIGLPGSIASALQIMDNLPKLMHCVWSAARTEPQCAAIRTGVLQLAWIGMWTWRGVSVLLLFVGIALLVSSFLPRPTDRPSRLERSMRRAIARETLRRQLADLVTLREDGAELRRRYKKPKPRVWGSIGLATPIEPVAYDGFEFDAWSGRVLTVLKGIDPPEFERYFQQCVGAPHGVERMTCYRERLDTIIKKLRWRFRWRYFLRR